MKTQADFPGMLQAFFTDHLIRRQQVSPNTIATHRDTFRLLIGFAQQHLKRPPSSLSVSDLSPRFIGSFLYHLEETRDNTPRTRNVRLSGIRSFFKYIAVTEPALCGLAQQVLAIHCRERIIAQSHARYYRPVKEVQQAIRRRSEQWTEPLSAEQPAYKDERKRAPESQTEHVNLENPNYDML